MPRPRGVKKTIEEKIAEKEQIIAELTDKLDKEKTELKILYDKQTEQKTKQILALLNDNNLTVENVEQIILQHLYKNNKQNSSHLSLVESAS